MNLFRRLCFGLLFIGAAPAVVAQANDHFANATVLSGASGQVSGTVVGATREAGDPTLNNLPLTGSVWYRWTAPLTGTARFQLFGQSFQSYIGAYSGNTLGSLVTLNQNTVTAFVVINATAGASYVIMVDRWSLAAGAFSLSWSYTAFPSIPVLTSAASESGTVGQPFAYRATFSGVPPPTGPYTVAGLPPGLSIDSTTGVISGIPTTAGTFSVTLGAVNSTGTGSGMLTLSIAGPLPPAQAYVFSTLAGAPGASGTADGTGSAARFFSPSALAVDRTGNVYVADGGSLTTSTFGHTIRKITPIGVVTTLAGLAGSAGSTDGTGSAARFDSPRGVAVDGAGNIFVTDGVTIRKITSSGVVTTLAGRATTFGTTDGPGTAARFWAPTAIAVDGTGNIYVSDTFYLTHTIRKITAAGVVTTLAGSTTESGAADGVGTAARFNSPMGLAVDAAGNIYVADRVNRTIRKVTPAGVVSTLAGHSGVDGSADGTGSAARFYQPRSIAIDATGNLYVADTYNHTIRKITSGGQVTTIGGMPGSTGSIDGVGTAARFSSPEGIAVDSAGTIYVASDLTIRKGVPATAPAIIPPLLPEEPVVPGFPVTLKVAATGTPDPLYQWRKNGVPIAGATSSTLSLGIVLPGDTAAYDVLITNPAGTVRGGPFQPIFRTGSALSNLSVRTTMAAGQTLIVGAVIGGGAKGVLVRAAGPALNKFGLAGMADPRLDLFTTGVVPLASNDDWPATLSPTFAGLGAFAFDAGSKDAALLQSVAGSFTVQARGTSAGTVLVEAYDAAAGGAGELPRLMNVSARNHVGATSDLLVAGLALSGIGIKQMLIRAVGPGLIPLGVSGVLVDPRLQVFDSNGAVIATNDNWDPALARTFTEAGAFGLPANSKDSALMINLNAGAVYTVQVSGADGGTGEALIEVYEIF